MKHRAILSIPLAILILTCNAAEPIFSFNFDAPAKIGSFEKTIVLPEEGFVKGRFGRGYLFERPAVNFLPENVARFSQSDIFQADSGSVLTVENGVLTLKGSGFAIPAFRTPMQKDFVFKTTALTASCEVKGPKGATVTLTVTLLPWDLPGKQKAAILEKSKKKHALLPDKSVPASFVLTGDWQKIASYGELDARTVEGRSATLHLTFKRNGALQVRKLQTEQTMCYPYKTYAPTSFLRGRTARAAAASGIMLTDSFLQQNFPVDNGTAAFWILLPSDERLPRPPGAFLGFARGWRFPMWNFRNGSFSTGLKSGVYLKKEFPVNRWVHVAVVWTPEKSVLYLDGKQAAVSPRESMCMDGRDKYLFSIGKTLWTEESADAVLDEIHLYGDVLSAQEIAALAARNTPLEIKRENATFRVRPVTVPPFFRDDPQSGVSLEVEAEKAGSITAEISSFETVHKEFQLHKGTNCITLPFHPGRMSPGKGTLRITLLGSEGVFFDFSSPYVIHKAVRRDLMHVLSWGGYRPTPLPYLQSLGINAVNTTPEKDLDDATNLGMLVNLDFRNHRELVQNDFDIEKTLQTTQQGILRMRGRYNWYGTLLNSEAYMLWSNFTTWHETVPTLRKQAEEVFGTLPDLRHIRVSPRLVDPADLDYAPDSLGVYEKTGPGYRFLDWYTNEGLPTIRLNRASAQMIRKTDPQNLIWVEPPFSEGEFRGMDMGGVWVYLVTLQEIVGKLRREWAMIRNAGCRFIQPTLTMYYWINSKEKAVYNGKNCILVRSPDQLKSDCWAAAGAVGMHELCFFNAYAWYDAEQLHKDYIPVTGYSREFGTFMREVFYPAALLLRDTAEPDAQVALWLPPEMAVYSEKNWNLYRNTCMWERNLALHNIHFDVLYGDSPHQRKPESYRTVILPMAKYVSRNLHQRLTDIAPTTRIVTDKDCLRTYPGMLQLDFKHNSGRPYDQETFRSIFPFLQELEKSGTGRSFRAVGMDGGVMYFERVHKGVRFLLVINNHWKENEISACAVDKNPRGFPLQPAGVPQKAILTVGNAADLAIYDFRTGKPLSFRKDGPNAMFETELGRGDAQLFCVYPAPFEKLTIETPRNPAKGQTAEIVVALRDRTGKTPPGRQILRAEVRDGKGNPTDESGWYVMEEGRAVLPLRIGLDAPEGAWKIALREHTSGLRAECMFQVK